MKSAEVRKKYLEFFEARGHKILPSSSLVPDNDPTTLFTGSGMQPMVRFLLGEVHPEGTRLVDLQKCIRTIDIDEVGDNRHCTFFEMIGNWSLGDYFKKEQLEWIFEFFIDVVGLNPNNFYTTVFIGDEKNNLPKDTEAAELWKELFKKKGIEAKDVELGSEENAGKVGMQGGRIFYYDAKKNWWSRAGVPDNMPEGEPGGPSSEMFYEFTHIPHDEKYGKECHPNCDCGRFIELGNNVFMTYKKLPDGSFEKLPKPNIDYGGGFERIIAASNNSSDAFSTDLFTPIIEVLEKESGKSYSDDELKPTFRIIADHIRAATFLIKDGVLPANKLQGYILRRLLRRAAIKTIPLSPSLMKLIPDLVPVVIDIYSETDYFDTPSRHSERSEESADSSPARNDKQYISQVVKEEIEKFEKTINKGLKEIEKIEKIDGKTAFDLYQTYGFPLEITAEIFREKGQQINLAEFEEEFNKHKDLSRTASAGTFKGGLADHSEETKKLHTATHLLQAAAKIVLGSEVGQRGSHITGERLRWDFNYDQKLTDDQIKQMEDLVNEQITSDLKVWFDIEDREEAIKGGATTNFGETYPEKVKVYKMGNPPAPLFSVELCGGPHVENTAVLKHFRIFKEESSSAGVRRIYATIEGSPLYPKD